MRTKTKNFFEDLFVLLIIGVIIFFVYIFFFSDDEKSETLLTNNIVQEKIEETKPIINEIKGQIENRVEKIVSVTKQEEQKVEEVSQNVEENPIHKHEVINNEIKEEEKKIEETSLNHTNHQENMAQTVAPIEETKTEVIAQTSNPIEISKNNEIVISEEAGKIETKTPDSQIQDIQTNENENRDTNDKTNVDQFFKNFERKVYDNINKNLDKSALRSGQFVNIRVTFLKDGGYEQLIYVSGNMGYFNLIKSSIEESFPVVIEDSIKGHFPRYYRMKIEF
ncbi:hypothetical protein PJV94_01625 [Aliarcobacter butzleri]|uniref:hypothetical protein n=1 Tax=Aliarcobacter butzleri TaxID=28197 RepID=UPI00063AE6B6|nr:hypothetical protein [Aliarcobacter butzleri]KLE08989.1 hypothetical protein AF79_07185 [Aliarcobacter butzleri L354]MCG3654753.1 hypothetical protein [Aliarcobacter butzleri]MCG3695616.1 hypothetical protein [Aliarcobacter butzleri]MDN5073148.1 hypothetical protein [Aliarcobacter butzleri]MDN5120380.1 hypothetical protein [Aliarcobacter butzleri]